LSGHVEHGSAPWPFLFEFFEKYDRIQLVNLVLIPLFMVDSFEDINKLEEQLHYLVDYL